MTALMDFETLPRDCLIKIITSTSPVEACTVASVSKHIQLIADSDEVWQSFLPLILPSSVESSSNVNTSVKQLYLTLSDHPILIEDGKKSFSLEKKSGKKCYMIASDDLTIVWIDSCLFWRWISVPDSRFSRVVELFEVFWLEIYSTINTRMLSENTLYEAYLVYKTTLHTYGFENQAVEVTFGPLEGKSNKRMVFLDRYDKNRHRPMVCYPRREKYMDFKERGDGWLEVELGEFYNKGDMEEELQMSVTDSKNYNGKGGLIIQGIEIRPKA